MVSLLDAKSGLSLILGLLLLLLTLAAGLRAALGLEVLVVDSKGLVDLGAESSVILETVPYELVNCFVQRGDRGTMLTGEPAQCCPSPTTCR